MNEETKKPRVKATKSREQSPAADYVQPNIFRVSTSVVPDIAEFKPLSQDGGRYCDVFLNTLARSMNQIQLNHRSTEVLDFGCKITLPPGYKLNGNVHPKYAALGLVCCSVYLDDEKRLKFVVTNSGKQTPIILVEKEPVGRIWIEPVYYFDWISYE